ncbi:hypothetical protein ACT7DH_05390 [Bacillus pacificus]
MPYGIDTVNAVLTEQADTGLAADYTFKFVRKRGYGRNSITRGNEKSSKDNELLVERD